MRTTININDHLYLMLKNMAQATSRSMGDVLTELIQKGLKNTPSPKKQHQFPVFDVLPGKAQPITLEHVKSDEDGF